MGPLRWGGVGGGGGQLFGRGAGSPAGARVAASRPVPFPTDALKLPRTRKGILGGGVLPPSRPGGGGQGEGRSPCLGLSLNSLIFGRGPRQGADLGGAWDTPQGVGAFGGPCHLLPALVPPKYLIPANTPPPPFFLLIFFSLSGPLLCLSAGVGAHPHSPPVSGSTGALWGGGGDGTHV